MDQARGNQLIRDRYETLHVLGRGGQGEVWKALDHQHGRDVVLKVRPVGGGHDRDHILTEARILLSLQPHPSLPLVREDFFWDDGYVLVMDWIEGTDLGALLLETGDPGLPVSSVLAWLRQAAAGIDHLHAQGVVHGDVKPANLVLTPEGRVVLVDFGISRRHGDGGFASIGSPGYAAPEAGAGGLSGAADVYGLAATAVALLTGAPPTGGRPEWEGVPNAVAIERAIRRGLASDPSRRPRSASELVERLQAHLFLDLPTGVVTFLLTDIEGSTARWENEPDAMADLLALHDGLVADAVEASAGHLLKTRGEGDSTFSVFRRASDAARAAVASQLSVRAATGLSVRMAIHSGEAETRDNDYFGRTVNRAARLRSVAKGGQILISAAAAGLVADSLPDECTLVDLGFRELRDLARGEQVFAIAHPALDHVESVDVVAPPPESAPLPSAPAPPPPAPIPEPVVEVAERPPFPVVLANTRDRAFVADAGALERLRVAWDAAARGDRRLVLLVGGPGSGTTQLAIAIAAEAYDHGAIVVHGRCDEGAEDPLQPFADALRRVTPWPGDVTPSMHSDPQAEQYRLFDAAAHWLAELARDEPVVLVLDDLHWATAATVRLFRHLLRSTDPARLLLIGVYRDDEVGRGHPLTELLADLDRVPGLERLTLDAPNEADRPPT